MNQKASKLFCLVFRFKRKCKELNVKGYPFFLSQQSNRLGRKKERDRKILPSSQNTNSNRFDRRKERETFYHIALMFIRTTLPFPFAPFPPSSLNPWPPPPSQLINTSSGNSDGKEFASVVGKCSRRFCLVSLVLLLC